MSKGLEKLYRLETAFPLNNRGQSVYREYTNSITPYYEDFNVVEKELKALEIIRNKFVMTGYILSGCPLKEYNSCIKKQQQLTQEEYDLLKEVLLNDNPQE
jgi:hypothetical protein